MIVREILRCYNENFDVDSWGKSRKMHLVTLEEPIEGLIKDKKDDTDVTELAVAVRCEQFEGRLHSGVTSDAIRAGCRRNQAKTRLERCARIRAATGHLCITTTHAGSLVETMRKMIEATQAMTSDLRSSLAEKLVAVVHLRQLSLTKEWGGESPKKFERRTTTPENTDAGEHGKDDGVLTSMLLPAIWRNVHGQANSSSPMVSVPSCRGGVGKPAARAPSCRGRSDFLESIWEMEKTRYAGKIASAFEDHVRRVALKADLEGV